MVKSALPMATRKWVRVPASLARSSRSRPIMAPNSEAKTSRMKKSVVVYIVFFLLESRESYRLNFFLHSGQMPLAI